MEKFNQIFKSPEAEEKIKALNKHLTEYISAQKYDLNNLNISDLTSIKREYGDVNKTIVFVSDKCPDDIIGIVTAAIEKFSGN